MADDSTRPSSIVFGVLALLGLLCVGGALLLLNGLGMWDTDFVFHNQSGTVLRNVRLVATREWAGTPDRVLGSFTEVPPGRTLRVDHGRSASFRLRVEFDTPGHHWRYDDVHYIDPDEWGDRDVRIGRGFELDSSGATRWIEPDALHSASELGSGALMVVPPGRRSVLRFEDGAWLRASGPARVRIVESSAVGLRVHLESGEIPEAVVHGIALEIQTPAHEVSLVLQNATGAARVTESEIVLRKIVGTLAQVWADGALHDLEDTWRRAR